MTSNEGLKADAREVAAVLASDRHSNPVLGIGTDQSEFGLGDFKLPHIPFQQIEGPFLRQPPLAEGLLDEGLRGKFVC